MKRGGPLKRRAPLRARAALRRTVRLRPFSAKRAVTMEERRALVAAQLEMRPYCEVAWDRRTCGIFSEHLHEPLTRARGGDALDPGNTVATCWRCHRDIHENPAEATARGWLRSAW